MRIKVCVQAFSCTTALLCEEELSFSDDNRDDMVAAVGLCHLRVIDRLRIRGWDARAVSFRVKYTKAEV